ncbi:MAG: MDR family MFS transporter [Bacillota bacterium]
MHKLQETLSNRKKAFILFVVMIGIFLSSLESTIVGTAMPQIIKSLNGFELYSWPFTAYMLTSTVFVPIFGRISDVYGRKSVQLTGLSIFLIASVLCSISMNMLQLIIFRAIQGVGGGILIANSTAITGDLFTPRERGKYQGFIFASMGAATICGPLLGGVISDNLSWEWIFLINVPISLAAILIIILTIPEFSSIESERAIDYKGGAALITTLTPLFFALTWIGSNFNEYKIYIIICLVVSSISFILFWHIEKRTVVPIIPFGVLENKIYFLSCFSSSLNNAVAYGVGIFIPFYIQVIMGLDALSTGLTMINFLLVLVFAGILSGIVISKTGKYKGLLIFSNLFTVAGLAMLYLSNKNATIFQINLFVAILAFGLGSSIPVFNITSQNALPDSCLGVSTSVLQFFKNMGATIGTAILGFVMLFTLNTGFNDNVVLRGISDDTKNLIIKKLITKDTSTDIESIIQYSVGEFDMNYIRSILKASVNNIFLVSLILSVAALVIVLFFDEIPLRDKKTSS